MIKAENIIIKEKYKGLKNLVLICEAMDEFAKQYHKEQLTLTDVSQQRELLAFRKWQKDNWKDVYLYSNEFMISEFKKANCG